MEYPEHEKLQEVKDKSEIIGGFLDWMFDQKGYHISEWRDAFDNGVTPHFINPDTGNATTRTRLNSIENPMWDHAPEGLYPVYRTINQWLAEYFDIDLDKIEMEKRQMLEVLRANQ